MSDFYLLDTYGAYRCLAVHPTLDVVAYDMGCMIIVWNTRSNSKISLLRHEAEVLSLTFATTQELLISVDTTGIGCVWDLDTGDCLSEFQYSTRTNLSQVKLQQFSGRMFAGAEAEEEGSGYRVSLWELDRGVMVLRAKAEEFSEYQLRALCVIEDPATSQTRFLDGPRRFVSVEDRCVKFWEGQDGALRTTKKLNVKQTLLDAVTSNMVGFIVILGAQGTVLTLKLRR